MAVEVKLEAFEGPLDLLLHLIDKNKVDIYDIPISLITAQYMEYLDSMEKSLKEQGSSDSSLERGGVPVMDTMSEFLVMAATLLDIKCRMLLPRQVNEEGEEEDPRSELVQQLLEYKVYKYMSQELKFMEQDAKKSLFKGNTMPSELLNYEEEIDYEELLKGLSLKDLERIFRDTMKRQEDKIDPIRSKFGKIEKEEVSLEDRTEELLRYAGEHRSFKFSELLTMFKGRLQMVVTFLAVLELVRSNSWNLVQEEDGGDILITA
ncbi:MAG: segregation/condensation protein A [Lachnospiraceae bacterium]|nr:segregation/condensation protein A [Lachnospiraceae bacterium]